MIPVGAQRCSCILARGLTGERQSGAAQREFFLFDRKYKGGSKYKSASATCALHIRKRKRFDLQDTSDDR